MKKKLLISVFALMVILPNLCSAQSTFREFVDSINWSENRSEITQRYDSIYSIKSHTPLKILYENIVLDEINVKSLSFIIDSVSNKATKVTLSLNSTADAKYDKETMSVFSDKMDTILYRNFGNPDMIKNEDRKWYKDSYVVDVMNFSRYKADVYIISLEEVKDKTNFRVARWGDSKNQIMKLEGKPDKYGDEKAYIFNDYVANMNCDVAYIFTQDKLSMAKYLFTESHTNKNDYIRDFRKLVILLSEKYGEPSWDAPEWRNSLYKNSVDDYGFAISLGHLIYSAGWFDNTEDISINLYGSNYKITLQIQYVSKKYEQIRKNIEKENSLNDL